MSWKETKKDPICHYFSYFWVKFKYNEMKNAMFVTNSNAHKC